MYFVIMQIENPDFYCFVLDISIFQKLIILKCSSLKCLVDNDVGIALDMEVRKESVGLVP